MTGVLRFLPLILVLAVLLFAGLWSDPGSLFRHQDKVHHVLGLFAFTVALRFALPKLGFFWLMALSLMPALLIEVGQFFHPSRDADAADLAASVAGALLGWVASRPLMDWMAARTRCDEAE